MAALNPNLDLSTLNTLIIPDKFGDQEILVQARYDPTEEMYKFTAKPIDKETPLSVVFEMTLKRQPNDSAEFRGEFFLKYPKDQIEDTGSIRATVTVGALHLYPSTHAREQKWQLTRRI